MNIQDKSPIAVLHEYCQKVLRVHPKFTVEESNNSNYPFEAVVFVDGTKYGRGQAQNKKAAKVKAAQETLEILLPGIMNQNKPNEDDNSMEFSTKSVLMIKSGRPLLKDWDLSPFCVLQDYKQRMHGKKDMELNFNVTVTGHHTLSYTMSLGPFSVTGPCKNSKSGKQIGAQLILK
ncbi:putative microprocessor complex subunit DGCR8, partial [Apostichopus japonicus]